MCRCSGLVFSRRLVAAAVLLGACSSGTNPGGSAAPSPAEVEAFVDRLCNAATPCCGEIGVSAPSPSSCKTMFSRHASSFIPALGSACLSEIAGAEGGAGCFRFGDWMSDPCTSMFGGRYGPRGPGESCTTDGECTAPPGGTSGCRDTGRCQWWFRGKAGDTPCVGDSANGAVGYDGDGSEKQGFVCRWEDGLFCETRKKPLTCRPYIATGAPCTTNSECASWTCSGPGCASTVCNGVCVAGKLGQSCADLSTCETGTYCEEPASMCVAQKPAASACSESRECTSRLCINGTCSRLDPVQHATALALCGGPGVLF